jgi:calcium/calmodulin-dependent protein kinase I
VGASLAQAKAHDVYSIGVVLYVALSGKYPFNGRSAAALVRQQRATPVERLCQWPEAVASSSAREFVRALMQPDMTRRVSTEGTLLHQWLQE